LVEAGHENPAQQSVQPTGGIRPDLQAFFGCRACRDTGFGFFLLPNIVHTLPLAADAPAVGQPVQNFQAVSVFDL